MSLLWLSTNVHVAIASGSSLQQPGPVDVQGSLKERPMRVTAIGVVAIMTGASTASAMAQNRALNVETGGWAEIAHHVSQHPSSELTIEFWVKALPNSVGRPVSKRPGDSGCYSVEFYPLTTADGGARITAASFFGTCGNGGSMFTPVGRWVHVAYVLKAGEATRYHLNGVVIEQLNQGPCALSAGTYPLAFGRTPGYPETQFYGRLDNIRLWSRARTAAQIAETALIEFDSAQAASAPNLIGSWSFNSGTVADARGVNLGSLQGNASIVDEPGRGDGADCNANGLLDAYEIAIGTLLDSDANGTPDCCEFAPLCLPCPADVDGNGSVNGVDLAAVLATWGTSGTRQPGADVNRDGIVNGADLAEVLSDWGSCQ
jgi:hypothetical protein